MNPKHFLLYGLVAVSVMSLCRADDAPALRLQLVNVVPGKGQLLVAVCLEADFLKPRCTYQTAAPATANPHVIDVPKGALPLGRYAVQVIYDRNSNSQLDSNRLGIPQEPVGFSRDARGRMGPPRFEQAAFEYDGTPQTLAIHLH